MLFRDVEFIVAALLVPWFFLTPILYGLDSVPGHHGHVVSVIHWANPAARRVVRKAAHVDCTAHGRVALAVQLPHTLEPPRVRLCAEDPCSARVARGHVDVLLERRVAELGEPEAVLLDEIDGEPVPPRRDGGAHCELLPQRLPRLDDAHERRAASVPHDRIAALVEPVVREVKTRPPRRRACVVDLDGRAQQGAGLDASPLERAPAWDERAHAEG